jgi:hypothetical protein
MYFHNPPDNHAGEECPNARTADMIAYVVTIWRESFDGASPQ